MRISGGSKVEINRVKIKKSNTQMANNNSYKAQYTYIQRNFYLAGIGSYYFESYKSIFKYFC